MFRHLFFVLYAFVLSVFLLPHTSRASDLEWNQTQIKIELKPDEEEAQAEFVVTNTSEEIVHITDIKTSCGCTGSILDQKTIQPGESSTIIGTFKKGNRQGLNHNRLQVFVDNQPKPIATLHMIVQIPRLINIQPPVVYWNRSSSKTQRKAHITLDENYVNKISSIEYDASLLTITEKSDPENKSGRILEIVPTSFETQLRQSIQVHAQGPDGTTAKAKLQVFVQP